MADYVIIQVQNTEGGNWVDIKQVMNDPGTITYAMTYAQENYNGRRVRAVDKNGKLVDIL